MKKVLFLTFMLLVNSSLLISQVSVSPDGSPPDSSAMFDVQSTDKGVVIPRMTFEQRNLIQSPVEGLMVYCTNCNIDGTGVLNIFQGGKWKTLQMGCYFPVAPEAGTHIPSITQIVWNWNAVPATLGYKWNSVNDYNTATDMGTTTTFTETGLTCGTAFGRYVWAYNICGVSPILYLTQSTLMCPPFVCGSDLTIYHTEGNVAPVTKTVTYSTVSDIPGVNSKCWITSNLGASHQATSVDDPTEASAGWYWQFDHKQGYMHDGTIRTPDTWDYVFSIFSDWHASNDPCSLEIDSSWRIPTRTEWEAVMQNGGWTDWLGPWNSDLKLHAAGILYFGELSGTRGFQGNYWSNSSGGSENSYRLNFMNNGCSIGPTDQEYGLSIRCLQATYLPVTCGDSITINHLAGEIAPVTKAVTYGTVTGIPGEPSKCWITSNLGADHQATAADDDTEPSAGWYWQFNLKQGYKHDGTTRTPDWNWVNALTENSDWIAAYDPCSNELGGAWRIPTSTEWTNVDASGSWTDWNGPWNSALKLHAAGYLSYSGGLLYSRGSYGYYWSSSQEVNTAGLSLYFNSSICNVIGNSKTGGFTIRCVRN